MIRSKSDRQWGISQQKARPSERAHRVVHLVVLNRRISLWHEPGRGGSVVHRSQAGAVGMTILDRATRAELPVVVVDVFIQLNPVAVGISFSRRNSIVPLAAPLGCDILDAVMHSAAHLAANDYITTAASVAVLSLIHI